MSWWRDTPIAHRGLHDSFRGAPENSLPAFEACCRLGIPAELDVRPLGDGGLAVFHDACLLRMTGRPGRLADLDRAALRDLRLLGTDEPVPLLADVLALVRGQVPLLIEIKGPGPVGRTGSRLLEQLADYRGPVAVASFDPFCLRWFRRRAPLLPRCQISCDFRGEPLAPWTKAALRHLALNGVSRPHFIAYDVRCLPCPCVARRRHAGLAVVGWTVRSRREMARATPYCDNFIFEGCPTGTPAIARPWPLAYNPPGLFGRIA